MNKQQKIIWLAGLFEGEACFRADKRNNDYLPNIEISMADYDVIEKASEIILEITSSRPKIYLRKRKEPWKQQYRLQMYGKIAQIVMEELLPYMGKRRTKKIQSILANRQNAIIEKAKNPPQRKLKPCGTNASYDRGCRCMNCKTAHRDYARQYRNYRKKRDGKET